MSRTSHEIDYRIIGDDLQFVEIGLDPGEAVIGEAGAMVYMDSDVLFETKMGDGSEPDQGMWGKLKSAGKRALSNESIFLTHFTNTSEVFRHVAFGAEFPGKVVPLDLQQHEGGIIAQKDAFLCAAMGTNIDMAFQKKLGAGLFGGEGFILQHLRGDGLCFLSVGGTVVSRRLENEKVLVDTGCLVAFETGVNYSIERAGNLKSMVFGGEGIFMATLEGTGQIWIQSLPFSRLANRIISAVPRASGSGNSGGDLLGNLLDNR